MLNYTITLIVTAIITTLPAMSSAITLPENTSQLIVVLAASWDTPKAKMQKFSRTHDGWKQVGGPIDVVLGGNGLAWGRGLHDKDGPGPVKKEGDRKTPAGIFRLMNAMGYSPTPLANATYPYVPIQEKTHCVDDASSRYYNQIVHEGDLTLPVSGLWKSSEIMQRKDDLYKWLIVVDHNVAHPQPGAGSCIFLHVWRTSNKGTAGCTAMAESDMVKLLSWLDSSKNPLLVQLPQSIYRDVWRIWQLPAPDMLAK